MSPLHETKYIGDLVLSSFIVFLARLARKHAPPTKKKKTTTIFQTSIQEMNVMRGDRNISEKYQKFLILKSSQHENADRMF